MLDSEFMNDIYAKLTIEVMLPPHRSAGIVGADERALRSLSRPLGAEGELAFTFGC